MLRGDVGVVVCYGGAGVALDLAVAFALVVIAFSGAYLQCELTRLPPLPRQSARAHDCQDSGVGTCLGLHQTGQQQCQPLECQYVPVSRTSAFVHPKESRQEEPAEAEA